MAETVFVSGAGRGLGQALVTRFLEAGFRVFGGARSSSGLAELLRIFPKTLTFIPLDVTNMTSIRRCAERVARETADLDILVNNAAINLPDARGPLDELDLSSQHLEQSMAVNAFGPLRLVQQLQPLLARGQRKLILNISSEAGSISTCGRDREFAYCMSKAALNMETKLLHNALSPCGFTVLAVHPGWVRTDMGGPQAHLSAEESAEGVFQLALQKRTPEDSIYLDYKGNILNW